MSSGWVVGTSSDGSEAAGSADLGIDATGSWPGAI